MADLTLCGGGSQPSAAGATLSFNASNSNSSITPVSLNTAQNTFSSVDIGNPADKSDRIVLVVAVLGRNDAGSGNTPDINDILIGGTSGTSLMDVHHVPSGKKSAVVRMFSRLVTTGTTADIRVDITTRAGGGDDTGRLSISVFWMTGIGTTASAIEYDTQITDAAGTDPATGTIDVEEGGAVVAAMGVGDCASFSDVNNDAGVDTEEEFFDNGDCGGSIWYQSGLSQETSRTITLNSDGTVDAQAFGAISIKATA